MSIDDEALARLRSLLAKATPGPWQTNECGVGYARYVSISAGLSYSKVGDNDPESPVSMCDDDMRLIAGAITALPALLDIAEAVARAPVVEVGDSDVEFWPILNGLEGKFVRIVPCTGGAE